MKKIQLLFYGLGYYNINQATVRIVKEKEPIWIGETYSGRVTICLEEEQAYTLIATSNRKRIQLVFYVDKKRKKYYFFFPIITYSITFHLTDSNYQNLPIEKGEIILWQE